MSAENEITEIVSRHPRATDWRDGAALAKLYEADAVVETTVEDLARRIELVRSAAEDAGRPRDAVSVWTQIWFTAFGSADDVRAAEQDLCVNWAGIPSRRLDRSPYLLFGCATQMAEALLERRET